MLRRQSKLRRAAGGWLRDPDTLIVKTKRMGDGEVTALLVSQRTRGPEDFEKEVFEALVRVRENLGKAVGASVLAYAIGLLTLSNMLSSLSTSGMGIERNGFSHVSLLLIGLTNLWFATSFTKASYIATWFGWRMQSAKPADKAAMLLRFPEAYAYFSYFPGIRGYPKHIWPARSDLRQIPPLIFIVLAILIFSMGAAALNIALALQVWASAYPTAWAAKLTVAGSLVLSLLALAVPRFNDFKIRYSNYAFSNLLTAMTTERNEAAHRRIALISLRGERARK